MNKITIIMLMLVSVMLAEEVSFTVRTISLKSDRDAKIKIDTFTQLLEDKLNAYDWELPLKDFEKIETTISLNIDKSNGDGTYTGMITVSSGMVKKTWLALPLKKDIFYNERDVIFSMDSESDPDIDSQKPSSIEAIIRFYSLLVLGENFDRLSYTDQDNFKLEGEFYYLQMYEFENLLNSAQERKNWENRIGLIKKFRTNKNLQLRKLNALLYNAIYFINSGKTKRAGYFVKPMYDIMSKDPDIDLLPLFKSNYYALGEVFAIVPDTTYISLLIKLDPNVSHHSRYRSKIKVNELPEEEPVNKLDKVRPPRSR